MKNRKSSEIPPALKSINVKAILRKRGVYTRLRMNQELKKQVLPLAKQMLKKKSEPKRHAQFTNEQVLAYWEKQIRIVEVLENKFEQHLEQFITKIVDGFLQHLESEIATEKSLKKFSKGYFDDQADELLVQAQLDFTPLLINQAILAGQEAYKLIGSDDVYVPYKLREQIAQNVTKFTESLIDTDRDKLIDIITDGLQSGKSVPEIRGMIQADFGTEYTKMQAQRITRTEVIRASNQAALDAYEQSGVVEAKQWLTAGATDKCAQYEGKIIPLNKNFYSDTDEFKDGDPPLHPNCKCVVLPVLIGEKAFEPEVNKDLYARITELESQIDKRTKEFKQLKQAKIDDETYIKSLEQHLGIKDE